MGLHPLSILEPSLRFGPNESVIIIFALTAKFPAGTNTFRRKLFPSVTLVLLTVYTIVGGFFSNGHIMGMTFSQPGGGNSNKTGLSMQLP